MKVVLMGPPGSGKGTQAKFIASKFNLCHVSTGDIFRDNIKRETPLGLEIKELIDKGNFCPDELTIELVKNRLMEEDCRKGFILDGFPRNLIQAEALTSFIGVDVVLNISVENEVITRRLTGRRSCASCGGTFHVDYLKDVNVCPTCGGELYIREDDNEDTVKHRLTVYENQTAPLIDYYEKLNLLATVDGDDEIENVTLKIIKVLESL
ncbi:MAG: adenylate kinase [Clostridiales bacterium]|nr:adenylate kinase [Clostridiales bacterium]